jgi:flagellar motor switch protein FliN/FliY
MEDLSTADSVANEGATDAAGVVASPPDFAEMGSPPLHGSPMPLERFYDVHVTVWAELGRVEMLLGDLLKMGEGSVIKLNRPVTAPVDLVAQGVRLGRGEVVVVDDCFAIRIKELDGRTPTR